MTSQTSPIPSPPLLESKLRLCRGYRYQSQLELIILSNKLSAGLVDQEHYDDSVVAIERDIRHLDEEIMAMTQFTFGQHKLFKVASKEERQPTSHHLKAWPNFFTQIVNLQKNFDLRLNDRDFQVGDVLIIEEYLPAQKAFSGKTCTRVVSCILQDFPGLEEGYCILGFTPGAGGQL